MHEEKTKQRGCSFTCTFGRHLHGRSLRGHWSPSSPDFVMQKIQKQSKPYVASTSQNYHTQPIHDDPTPNGISKEPKRQYHQKHPRLDHKQKQPKTPKTPNNPFKNIVILTNPACWKAGTTWAYLGAAEVDDMRKLLVDPMKDSPSQVEKPTFFLWLKAYRTYTDTYGSISL